MAPLTRRSVLPGFGLTLGLTLTWLSLLILIPLASLFLKTTELSFQEFITSVTSHRVVHALSVSFGIALAAALVNLVAGILVVWALVAVVGTLDQLPDLVTQVENGPAILIIGDVVEHSLPWNRSDFDRLAASLMERVQ